MGFDASSVHTWRERGVHIWASFKTAQIFFWGILGCYLEIFTFGTNISANIGSQHVVLLKILEINIMLCFFVGNMIFSSTCFTQRLFCTIETCTLEEWMLFWLNQYTEKSPQVSVKKGPLLFSGCFWIFVGDESWNTTQLRGDYDKPLYIGNFLNNQ